MASPNLDIGIRAAINTKDQSPSNSHDGLDSMNESRCPNSQNVGQNKELTTSLGHFIGSTASFSAISLPPSDSNVVMMLGDRQSSSPSNFLSSSLIAASSNSLETVLSISDSPSLPQLDIDMGSNTQNFPSNNGSNDCLSSEIEATAISSNSSLGPSSSIVHSFGSQNSAVDISDSISCISNQDNIFEDILNELLPPSSANSGTWQFTGKL